MLKATSDAKITSMKNKALKHAVEVLTKRRNSAPITPKSYVKRIKSVLEKSEVAADVIAAGGCTDNVCVQWESFWESKVGKKEAKDLIVAYVSGIEPLNDIQKLIDLGVHPFNINVFKSDSNESNYVLESIRESKFTLLKVIHIPFEHYLESTPCIFDIIWFDTWEPLPSVNRTTLRTITNIFKYQRLSPIGILISNFAQPDVTDLAQLNSYSDLISNYLYSKVSLESENLEDGAISEGFNLKSCEDGNSFYYHIQNNFSDFYGQYITRQLFDIACFFSPMSRLSNTGAWDSLFCLKPIDIAKRFDGDNNDEDTDLYLDPNNNPIGWTMASLLAANTEDNFGIDEDSVKLRDTWHRELSGLPPASIDVQDIVEAYGVIRSQIDDTDLFAPEFHRLISKYRAMLSENTLCNATSSILGLDAIIAQFAYPSHYNVEETKRFFYTVSSAVPEKTTNMFLDVIVFDTCRYIHDWFDLSTKPDNLIAHELVYRFALDSLAKHIMRYNHDYLFTANIADINDEGFLGKLLSPRFHVK